MIKTCPSLTPGKTSTRLTHMNSTSPNIHGLPKVHKTQCPIRPMVNWIGTPAYKLAKYLSKLLTTCIPLPSAFNVLNTTHLMEDILNIPHKPGIKLASLDIENMYPNIPTNEIIPIIEYISRNYQLDSNTIHDLTTITNTVLEQNYFVFQNTSYSQTSGLAMGAPSSAVLLEMFLQYLEHTKIIDILIQHNIIGYFRFVDDILVIYDTNLTNINKIRTIFNTLTPTLKFTLEKLSEHHINFMDLTIHNTKSMFSFSIYRKPTFTDIIIPAESSHPSEHKHAAIRYLTNRLHRYQLNDTNKKHERQIIEQIVTNNGYNTSIIRQLEQHRPKQPTNNEKTTWAKFTYFGRQTHTITRTFKDTHVRITFKTNNTINKILTPKPPKLTSDQQYQQSGIYCLTCPDCHTKYIGQTERPFHKRFQEHFHDFKHNIRKSNFATHLLDHNHSIGPINEVMNILHTSNKGRSLDTIERLHIFRQTRLQTQINDRNTVKPNAIFDVICSLDPSLSVSSAAIHPT